MNITQETAMTVCEVKDPEYLNDTLVYSPHLCLSFYYLNNCQKLTILIVSGMQYTEKILH